MEGEGRRPMRRGCIKTTMGPWVVRRLRGKGQVTTSLRRPSDQERENNRQRERHRRRVAARIYSCLRQYGNYSLPKHPEQNDVLRALCEQAGWHVEEDGTVYRKRCIDNPPSALRENFNALLGSQQLSYKGCHFAQPPPACIITNVDYPATNAPKETTKDACWGDELELTLGLPIWSM